MDNKGVNAGRAQCENVVDHIISAKDSNQWRDVVNAKLKFPFPQRVDSVLIKWVTTQFWRTLLQEFVIKLQINFIYRKCTSKMKSWFKWHHLWFVIERLFSNQSRTSTALIDNCRCLPYTHQSNADSGRQSDSAISFHILHENPLFSVILSSDVLSAD